MYDWKGQWPKEGTILQIVDMSWKSPSLRATVGKLVRLVSVDPSARHYFRTEPVGWSYGGVWPVSLLPGRFAPASGGDDPFED